MYCIYLWDGMRPKCKTIGEFIIPNEYLIKFCKKQDEFINCNTYKEMRSIPNNIGSHIEVNPEFSQKMDVKTDIKTETNIDINIKVDLPTIQSDFENLKDLLITADPCLESYLKEIGDNLDEVSANTEKEKLIKSFNKLGRFLKKLGDENSDIHKIIKGTKKGIEYTQKLGKTYNNFAQWLALPQVPDMFLEK